MLQRCRKIRSLQEVLQDEDSFKGSMSELLQAVARDEGQDVPTRLACATQLMKAEPSGGGDDLKDMTDEQLRAELDWLHRQQLLVMTDEQFAEAERKTIELFDEMRIERAKQPRFVTINGLAQVIPPAPKVRGKRRLISRD